MVFKYLLAIGFIGATTKAIADVPALVSSPGPTIVQTPISIPTTVPVTIQSPMIMPQFAKDLAPDPKPIQDPDPSPIQHAILNALEKQKNSTKVDELITITLGDVKYAVSVKLSPRAINTGFPTLSEALTTILEDVSRYVQAEYSSYVYKNGKKIGITDLTPGSTGNNYRISRLSLKFKKIS